MSDSETPVSNPTSPQQSDPTPDIQDTNEAIAATPITIVAPGETTARVPGRVRSNPDEMAKRPGWLPDDWRMETKTRTSGSTAGLIDRYYYGPTGRKCRSKNEVMKCLGKENKSKDESNSKTDDEPSESHVSKNKKKRKSVSKTDAEVTDAEPSEKPVSEKKKKRASKSKTDAEVTVAEPSEIPVNEKKKKQKASSKTDAEPSSTPANGKPKKLRPKRKKSDTETPQVEEDEPQPEETTEPQEV